MTGLNPGLPNAIQNVDVVNGFNLPTYDYLSLATATTSDTYTFKVGGSGGATVAVLVINYTDSGKATITDVTRTV